MSRPINGDDVFRAIAHPRRREMIAILKKRPRTPSELRMLFDISQPSISRHLHVLRESKVVMQKRRGRERVYHLNHAALREVTAWAKPIVASGGRRS